jgi:hypothetical protein
VLGVVLGTGRLAQRRSQPVGDRSEPDQEAERAGDERHDDVRVSGLLGLPDGEARDRPQPDDQPESDCRAGQGAGRPAEPAAGQLGAGDAESGCQNDLL